MAAMKDTLRQLFLSTLEGLSLDRVMPEKLACQDGVLEVGGDRIELGGYKNIVVVTIGKAAFPMGRALAETLEGRAAKGIVVTSAEPEQELDGFSTYIGGHPYPDAQSFRAADVTKELLDDLGREDLVIYLLSGGGSAICEKPVSKTISLEDCREFYRLLVTCGANIVDMNVLRKHFSGIKGGRLAKAAHPARQVTLYVSDVPADKPSTVASGPTMPDESTIEDCYAIVDRLKLGGRFPRSVQDMFDQSTIPETPKPGDAVFQNSAWHCLLGNQDGLDRLAAQAKSRGWVCRADMSVDDWPLERAVEHLLSEVEELRSEHPGQTVALLTGGELSWPVTGDGIGGRNQAFVLACAERIAERNIAVVSAGTDGVDGNSSAAGALADGNTAERASKLGMDPSDYQQRSDSYHFFEHLDDLVITGPTGNNIRDLRMLVAWQV